MPRQVQLSHASLIEICRVLRHSLHAGISIVKVFSQQALKGPSDMRLVAGRVAQKLKQGDNLTSAMATEDAFPPLMLSLVTVGEQTGHLPEVFADLEEYFKLQQQIQRKFRAQVIMPAIQFVIAALIVALLIWILGILGSGSGGMFGLSGATGALIFLAVTLGTVVVVVLGARWFIRRQTGKVWFDALLINLPLLGGSVRSFALSRFALAMSLTLDSRMPVVKAIRLSLKASGNAAFEDQTEPIERELQQGETLSHAINEATLLPQDFRQIVSTAEQSGRLPEAMRHQYKRYQEDGERQMKAVAQLAVWVIWAIYAIFMIIMIFRIASIYFAALPK